MSGLSLHHIQLAMPAGGEDKARAFWRDTLGFSEAEKPENLKSRGGCWFEHGSARVHLGVDADFRPALKAHPAFEVGDLAGIKRRLEQAGYATRTDEPLPGYDRFYVDDPFGNRIEFLAALR